MRNSMRSAGILTCLAALAVGCTYNGAIYSQYTAVDLTVAVRPEDSRPVDVNFGYARRVGTLVPKMKSDRHANEASSLVSKERVGATIDPNDATRQNLTVDAAFASGNAAIIASLPKDKTFQVLAENGEFLYSGKTDGSPGARLAAAFKPTARFACAEMKHLNELLQGSRRFKDEYVKAAVNEAADDLPKDFRDAYENKKKNGIAEKDAFMFATMSYTKGDPVCGPKFLSVVRALEGRLK